MQMDLQFDIDKNPLNGCEMGYHYKMINASPMYNLGTTNKLP